MRRERLKGPHKLPEEEFNMILALYRPGRWFQLVYDYFQIMDPAEAVLLSYIFNIVEKAGAWERNEGWVYLRTEDVSRDLNYNSDKQVRSLRKLHDMGVIETTMMGDFPRKRHVKINVRHLHTLVMDSRGQK